MQANAQARQTPGTRYRIVSGRRTHHQAGGIEHAVAMGQFHCFVYGQMKAEIISSDYQATLRRSFRLMRQDQASCERRKW